MLDGKWRIAKDLILGLEVWALLPGDNTPVLAVVTQRLKEVGPQSTCAQPQLLTPSCWEAMYPLTVCFISHLCTLNTVTMTSREQITSVCYRAFEAISSVAHRA
jgi:hypothetical protein